MEEGSPSHSQENSRTLTERSGKLFQAVQAALFSPTPPSLLIYQNWEGKITKGNDMAQSLKFRAQRAKTKLLA